MDREDAMRREIAENIAGVAGVLDTRARWVLGLAEGDSKAEPGTDVGGHIPPADGYRVSGRTKGHGLPLKQRGTVAVDWDGTLVDPKTQEWLPDAKWALRQLLSRYSQVVVHTVRATYPEGVVKVEGSLLDVIYPADQGRIVIAGKPAADVYIDDRAVRYAGDWQQTMRELRGTRCC